MFLRESLRVLQFLLLLWLLEGVLSLKLYSRIRFDENSAVIVIVTVGCCDILKDALPSGSAVAPFALGRGEGHLFESHVVYTFYPCYLYGTRVASDGLFC